MNAGPQPLDLDEASRLVRATLHGSSEIRIGAEVEWLVFDLAEPERTVVVDETAAAAGEEPLPAGGTVSVEPGGQLELSTSTFTGPDRLVDAIRRDASELVRRFHRRGLALVAFGLDPLRPPHVSLDAPRYRTMERSFRRHGPEGVRMMASTAAVQVSVDPGPVPLRSWTVLGAAAPLLSATFANSCPQGGGSARQRVWAATDPARTAPVPTGDPQAWVDYVLDTPVMLVADGSSVSAPAADRTFRSWLDDVDHPPTPADLAVHLTTMFPPVRPRGHLEVRVVDAVPAVGRAAAVGLVWALATDRRVGDVARRLAEGLVLSLIHI